MGISAGVLLLFLVGVVIFWRLGWHRLEASPTPPHVVLEAQLRPYAEHGEVFVGEQPLVLRYQDADSGGELLFFGSLHTSDPQDPQIDQIIAEWDGFSPTLGLCESRLGLYIGGVRRGVTMFGEAGLPYSLGRRDNVPVGTLEPSWDDEITAVLENHNQRDAAAFYFLRVFLGEARGAGPERVERLARQLLRKRAGRPGLAGSFASLEEFGNWWEQTHAAALGPWRTLPGERLWPRDTPDNAMGAVALSSNRARDHHMAKLMIDRVRAGERVFAVCGRSHAASLQPVFEQALQQPDADG